MNRARFKSSIEAQGSLNGGHPKQLGAARLQHFPSDVGGPRPRIPNLPGWCWARIKQLALIGSSSSLHSEACKALGGSDGVVHSTISLAAICIRAVAKDSCRHLPSGSVVEESWPGCHLQAAWMSCSACLDASVCEMSGALLPSRDLSGILGLIVKVSYLLGLLAMIKCSICSYQCDNWYAPTKRLLQLLYLRYSPLRLRY